MSVEQPETAAEPGPTTGRRLRRAERREQILAAATRAFARAGFAATSLDDIAAEAQISRVILYRHFDSKAALYRAVLDKICARLAATVGEDNFTDDSIAVLIGVAAEDPDAFRLLFHHALREPEFRDVTDQLQTSAADIARRGVAELLPPGPWTEWAARLAPTLTIDAVIAWLDAGQPDPNQAADRIRHAIQGLIQAAQP